MAKCDSIKVDVLFDGDFLKDIPVLITVDKHHNTTVYKYGVKQLNLKAVKLECGVEQLPELTITEFPSA